MGSRSVDGNLGGGLMVVHAERLTPGTLFSDLGMQVKL